MELRRNRLVKIATAFLLLLSLVAQAELLVNWELGVEMDVPDHWLRRDLKDQGIKLSSDEVRMELEPFSGITQQAQIERLHKLTKEDGYEFKSERSFPLNQVPTHEMVFFKDGSYKLFYVLQAGQRGFLWTVHSRSTDSEAFLEGQDILNTFVVRPQS